MKIIGVNGINTHGHGNIDVMLSELAKHGHETVDVHLPKRHFISARWGAKRDAEAIVDLSNDGDVVIAHSFGCLRTAKAMKHRDYRAVFMFRPAMSRHYDFKGRTLDTDVFCFSSPDDLPILIGQYLLLHPFGAAGRKGFSDPRVINMRSAGGHNADFEERLHMNVGFIDRSIRHLEKNPWGKASRFL